MSDIRKLQEGLTRYLNEGLSPVEQRLVLSNINRIQGDIDDLVKKISTLHQSGSDKDEFAEDLKEALPNFQHAAGNMKMAVNYLLRKQRGANSWKGD